MKKIKKILLAFAPLTAIAIATPIALTACSDTTTNTTPPTDGGGTGDGSTGGNGNTQIPIAPSFTKDSTNSESFMVDNASDAKKIIDNYKAAKGQVAAEKVLTDELANFPKKDSKTLAQDVLNMWSNNNWFAIKQTAKDPKVKETFISSLTINKAEVDSTSKATFDVEYKSAFNDSTGKLYEATQVLKVDKVQVDASTQIEIPKEIPGNSYKIDGKDQPLTSTSLFAIEASDPKTNLENNLKQNKVLLDAKQVFQTFINNHKIMHAEDDVKPAVVEGTWSDSIKTLDDNKTKLNADKTQVDVFLTTFAANESWFGLKKGATESNVRQAIYTANGKINNLNDAFKNLVNNKDVFTEATVVPSVSKGVGAFVITLKKSDSTTKTLKINVKFA